MKLGLKDPVPGAVRLQLSTYADLRKLPVPPMTFGRPSPVKDWGDLGNKDHSNCAFAGPCHQIMLWCAGRNIPAPFTTEVALANYTEVTGFNPNAPLDANGENPTDQGALISDVGKYWAETGFADATGTRHKIEAFVGLDPGNLSELWVAIYLFKSVGLGFDLPESALDQTRLGKTWDVVRGSAIAGGHYVPAIARPGCGVTWGELQGFTNRFYQKYNNQGICALSYDMIRSTDPLDGFATHQLLDDLFQIGR